MLEAALGESEESEKVLDEDPDDDGEERSAMTWSMPASRSSRRIRAADKLDCRAKQCAGNYDS